MQGWGADSPKLHIKRTQKIGWWEKSPSDSGFQCLSNIEGSGS